MKYSQCCFGLRFSFTPTPHCLIFSRRYNITVLADFCDLYFFQMSRIKQCKNIKRQQLWGHINFSWVVQFTISIVYIQRTISRHHPFHYLKSQLSIYCALFCLEHNKHSFSFFIANVHIQNLGCCLCVNQF